MTLTRTFVLLFITAFLFAGCSKEPDEGLVKATSNPLLEYVSADTPYVYADLEPVPEEITDAYIERFQPVMDIISQQVSQFQADYQAGVHKGEPVAELAAAVLDEVGGTLSKESLGKVGISMNAHHAVYGMGIFPVIRIGLSDAEALRNAISRIETRMGYQLPVKDLNGSAYWRVTEDDMPVGVYLAILDQQLIISMFPVRAENRLLAAFLGQEMPARSMAANNALGIMNKTKGYTGYGSGMLDIQKLADELLNPDSDTRSILGERMNAEMDSLDAVCLAEMKSIIARTPRMTFGTTRLTSNELAVRYDLEIESTLASGLAALVSDTPAAGTGNKLLSASLAVKVGKLRSFILEKATAVFETPYQCARLQEFNDQAAQLMTQLNIPMPPMVNNLMGVRVEVDSFDPRKEITEGNGLLAIHVDKPEMFVGMASMLVPGFEKLDLANQKEPVRIPAEMLRMEGLDVFALMSDNAIGASIGKQHVQDLDEFLNRKPQNAGTFMSVSYDMAKQMEIEAALTEHFQFTADEYPSPVNEYSEALKQVYRDILDRSTIEMRLTGDGLHVESSMTFK